MYGLKASHVVDMARKYKNYQEKSKLGTRAQMWNFHWSPGYNNYTIWAMLYNDYVRRNFQGQAWCAMFGADVFVLALKNVIGGLPFGADDERIVDKTLAQRVYGRDASLQSEVRCDLLQFLLHVVRFSVF